MNGLWSPSVGGGVCDIQLTCHMCTLYIAHMALGDLQQGGGVRVTSKICLNHKMAALLDR